MTLPQIDLAKAYFEPKPLLSDYTEAQFTSDMKAVDTAVNALFTTYTQVSESVRGFSPNKEEYKADYSKWLGDVKTLQEGFEATWKNIYAVSIKLCRFADRQKIGDKVDAVTATVMKLLVDNKKFEKLTELFAIAEPHRLALVHFKKVIKEMESAFSYDNPKLIIEGFEGIKSTIQTQQASLINKKDELQTAVRKIHLYTLDFVLFTATYLQKRTKDDSIKSQLGTIIQSINELKISFSNALEARMSLLNLHAANEEVTKFLDNTSQVSIDTYEYFRQGEQGVLVTYFPVRTHIQDLNALEFSIVKVRNHLMNRMAELAKDPEKPNAALPVHSFKEEITFFKDCLNKLECRLESKRKEILQLEFSKSVHALFYCLAQREGALQDLKETLVIFEEYAFSGEKALFMLAYKDLTALIAQNETPKNLRAVRTLEEAILYQQSALQTPEKDKSLLHRLYEVHAEGVATTISHIGLRVLGGCLESEKEFFEKLFEGATLDTLICKEGGNELLSEKVREIVAKLVSSQFFKEKKASIPELDLLLFILREHTKLKPAFEMTKAKDALFARDLAIYEKISNWQSSEAASYLKRVLTVFSSIGSIKNASQTEEGRMQQFLRFSLAKQKMAELAQCDAQGRFKAHLETFMPLLGKKLEHLASLQQNQHLSYFAAVPKDNDKHSQLYNLLLPLVYGEITEQQRQETEQKLFTLLHQLDLKLLTERLTRSFERSDRYLGLQLFSYVVKKVVSSSPEAQGTNFYRKSTELYKSLLEEFFFNEDTLKMAMNGCGPCFVMHALEMAVELPEPKFPASQLVNRVKGKQIHDFFKQVVHLYRMIHSGQYQSETTGLLEILVRERANLGAFQNDDRLSFLMALAIDTALKEIDEHLTKGRELL